MTSLDIRPIIRYPSNETGIVRRTTSNTGDCMQEDKILEDSSPQVLAGAIEENAIACCVAWKAWPELKLHEEPDLLWTLSGVPFFLFNNVLRTAFAPDRVEERIGAALAPFRKRGVPMTWWVGPSARPENLTKHLKAEGLEYYGSAAGMALDLDTLGNAPHHSPGLSIEQVLDVESLCLWSEIVNSVYEFPEFVRKPWVELFSSIGLNPDGAWRHYLARLDGAPVAASSLFLGAGVAGVVNVATLPEFRRRGIGAAITAHPLYEARHAGFRIGTLCSSGMGDGVYRGLGFKEYCRMSVYVWSTD